LIIFCANHYSTFLLLQHLFSAYSSDQRVLIYFFFSDK
jgi:hypothetical protein